MEYLTRSVVAVNQGEGKVYVGWRLLGTDPDGTAFNVYRTTGDGAPVKLNAEPITVSTNLVDNGVDLTKANGYFVRPVSDGQEQVASAAFTLPANAPARQYVEIPLKTPAGYAPGDASAGDLDGDGDYELIVHMSGRGRDNAQAGMTDPPILHAYKLDGTLLWSIDLGRNIREGQHYTQFIVYDLDGDGVAEIACKTIDGTVDGKGVVIGDKEANWVNADGKILEGPEYFTIFDGRTGAARATVDYIPPRGDIGGWGGIGGNGGNDRTGNRVDRFLACAAYLDGERPSVVMCRGVYGRTVLAAWDFRDGKLTSRWVFDSAVPGNGKDGKPNADYGGMGGHSLSVADVDDDGRDEIIYHSMVVDDDGRGLFTTGFRHGDALHVSRFDPAHPNPIVYGVHENEGSQWDATTPAVAAFDAKTGQTIWRAADGEDSGRCLAADIDPRHAGAEMWGGPGGLRTCRGEVIGAAPRSCNFAIWWDGDLLREILDRNMIWKWDWQNARLDTLLVADGCMGGGAKASPNLSADLFGDWREEVVFRTADRQSLRIYTTTIPTRHRLRTLMHDPQYRMSIAWQNVTYNQPPHTSFYLGEGMKQPPRPRITTTASRPVQENRWRQTAMLPADEAQQAAAADDQFVYAVTNRKIAKYDRKTQRRIAESVGQALHLNSGFFWEGRLYCAHSNYPELPEESQIMVLDPESMRLLIFKDFGNFGGSLTWAIRHDGHWWCNFARYGKDNAQTFLVKFDNDWVEKGRWTYPSALIRQLGQWSLSGGVWRDGFLVVTGHDEPVLFRLRLPGDGTALELVDRQAAPFTGQGIAHDLATGGLVGINRNKRQVIFVAEPDRAAR